MSLAKTEWAMKLFVQDRKNRLPRGTRLSVAIEPLKETVFDLEKVHDFNAAFAQVLSDKYRQLHQCCAVDSDEIEQKRKSFLASIESQMAGSGV